jgi:hypothetical protein
MKKLTTIEEVDPFNVFDIEPLTYYDYIIDKTIEKVEDEFVQQIKKKAIAQTNLNNQQKLKINKVNQVTFSNPKVFSTGVDEFFRLVVRYDTCLW